MVHLDKSNIANILSLSPMQGGMLFHYINYDKSAYCIHLSIDCIGEIDDDKFEHAWKYVIDLNEMLRTIFRWEVLKNPCQIILKKNEPNIEKYDYSAFDEQIHDQLINELIEKEKKTVFNLAQEVPFKVILCKRNKTNHTIILKNHHIIYDGWSNGIILNEFFSAYNKLCSNLHIESSPKPSFKTYIDFYLIKSFDKHMMFWEKYLENYESIIDLSLNNTKNIENNISSKICVNIPYELVLKLNETAKKNHISISTLFYSAWSILLSYYLSINDIVFGTVVSGRNINLKNLDKIVGLFINTVPLRINLSKYTDIYSVIGKVNFDLLNRKEHEILQLSDIIKCTSIKHNKIFNNIVTIENYPINKKLLDKQNKLYIEAFNVDEYDSFDLGLNVELFDIETVKISIKYKNNKFCKDNIIRLSNHFINILSQLTTGINKNIDKIEILTENEKIALLYHFNSKKIDYPQHKTYHELFDIQAERYSDNVAIIYKDHHITYRELNVRSNNLAKELLNQGVRPDEIIGIISDRSHKSIIGIFGIMKSGCAYLPIDKELPSERIDYMLRQANVSKLIIEEVNRSFVENLTVKLTLIDPDFKRKSKGQIKLKSNSKSSNLVYVMYTSGSTGFPKGVCVEHRQLINNAYGIWNKIRLEKGNRFASVSTLAADLGNTMIFPPLIHGCTLLIIQEELITNHEALAFYFRKNPADCLKIVPSHLDGLLLEKSDSIIPRRLIILGGESTNKLLVNKIRKLRPQCRIMISYGPTETTINILTHEVPILYEDSHLPNIMPLGTPLDNCSIFILNRNMQILPIDTIGEIYIGGDSVSRGYINDDKRTSEKFIPSPFNNKKRLYKTGDFGKWTEDGNIIFTGRQDDQVKIRGYRIELDEIKHCLQSHKDIKGVAVVVKNEEDGGKNLCAYYESVKEIDLGILRDHLKKQLPNYMIPSNFVFLTKIPLTANGKVDIKELPEPIFKQKDEYDLPRNITEEILVKVWADVLKKDNVGINDDYFMLGGDSIKTIQISSRMRKLGYRVDMRDIFNYPTIALLSSNLDKLEHGINQSKITDNTLITSFKEPEPTINDLTYRDISIEFFQSLTTKYNIKDIYRLSPMQSGMLFHWINDKDSNLYFVQLSYRLNGKLDINAFKHSLNFLLRRYDILRTVFIYRSVDQYLQVVLKECSIDFYFKDISTKANKKKYIEKYKEQDKLKGFDLSIAPLIRISIIQIDKEVYELIWSSHHILMDGWCNHIIISEIIEIYNSYLQNIKPILPEVRQYVEYIRWIEKQNKEHMRLYWQNYLLGYETLASIPRLRKENNKPHKYINRTKAYKITQEKTIRLKKLAIENKVTINTVIQTLWGILLGRYNNSNDVVFGNVVSGRPSDIAGIESMVGLFINTIPVRIRYNENTRINELIKEVQTKAIESEPNHYYPLAELQSECELKQKLLDHIVVFENYPIVDQIEHLGEKTTQQINVKIKDVQIFGQTNYDLRFIIYPGENIEFVFRYNSNAYEALQIERLGKHLERLIEQIIEKKNIEIRQIEILTDQEKHQLLYDFNNTKADYPKDKVFHKIFEEQVEKTPENIAIVYEGEKLTYKELNIKSNQLANLIRKKQYSPKIIGIRVEPSLEMIIGIIGIIKSGSVFMPIDAYQPISRSIDIFNDSGSRLLITQEHLKGDFEIDGEIIIINNNQFNYYKINNPSVEGTEGLYAIYTSGSTGKPKGVLISNNNIMNYYTWFTGVVNLTSKDKGILTTSFAFDAIYTQLISILLKGGEIHLISRETYLQAPLLIDYIDRQKITILKMTPTLFNMVINDSNFTNKIWKSVRFIMLGGEAIVVEDVEKIHKLLPEIQIMNHYGPTETTIGSIAKYIDDIDSFKKQPTIGKPINNIQVYILGKYLELLPIGIIGELCIAGDGVGIGYLNRIGLTSDKFIDFPCNSREKLYKTGDLARWLPDGNVQLLGRMDHQVKIRGNRIELVEIENQINEYEKIKESIVIAKGEGKDKYLCAYYISEIGLIDSELREFLFQRLPSYMIPSFFIRLERMPLTPNGKIDKKALSKLDNNLKINDNYVEPTNDFEKKLVEIWEKVLGKEKIRINSNFFDLGGHSLLSNQVINNIRRAFEVEINFEEFFNNPQIDLLAELIKVKKDSKNVLINQIIIPKAKQKQYYLASSAQKRIYFQQLLGNDQNTSYNISTKFFLEGKINIEHLTNVLNSLIERHESLRTEFILIDNNLYQEVKQKCSLTIESVQVNSDQMDSHFQDFVKPFDLRKAPLMRAKLYILDESKSYLFLGWHHIVTDLYSNQILTKEFISLYKNMAVPELKLQYKDYSEWQNNIINSTSSVDKLFWLNVFNQPIPSLDLPTDYPRPLLRDQSKGEILVFYIKNEKRIQLDQIIKNTSTTRFIFLLAIYNVLLHKYTGKNEIIVGSTIAGRNHTDLQNIVGLFINMLALKNNFASNLTFKNFLKQVKENALLAFQHQNYPFDELVKELRGKGYLKATEELFTTEFALNNIPVEENIELNDLFLKKIEHNTKFAKFDLHFQLFEIDKDIRIVVRYSTELFKEKTVKIILNHFNEILQQVLDNIDIKIDEIQLSHHFTISKSKIAEEISDSINL